MQTYNENSNILFSWKSTKKLINEYLQETSIEKFKESPIIHQVKNNMVTQLLKDSENLKNDENVTDCGVYAPRMHSSLDRKTRISHDIALAIFPPKDNEQINLVWSYIQYQRLIAKLAEKYRTQEKEKKIIEQSFKKARFDGQKKLWCSLKNRPISKQIAVPEAMPVQVSTIEELEPFFNFLKSNKPILPEHTDNNGSYMKFKRGAVYTDGRMDLCKQVVGPNWIKQLMDSILNNDQIKHFLLGNNIINIEGAKAISEFLLTPDRKSRIETWYLAGNSINTEGIGIICDALKLDQDMKYLWLKRNPLYSEGMKSIAELLKVHNKIEILDLHNTAVFDDGLAYLVEGLKENKSLRNLYLDANGITVKGVKYLAEYFMNRKEIGITSLWIDMNRLDDEGIEILLESVKNYSYLKRLNIGSNRASWKAAEMVYKTLTNHKSLEVLDLGVYKSTADMGELSNKIEDDGAKYIAKFISENKKVKLLSILHNHITNEGIELIATAMEKNDTILFLNYTQYGVVVSQKVVKKISDKLKENKDRVGDPDERNPKYIMHSKEVLLIGSIYRNK